jgi:MFS family permease
VAWWSTRPAAPAPRSSSARREHGPETGAVSGSKHFRELLGLPHAKAMVAWSLLGRLPLGMTPIALLFLVRGEGHGYGAAGIVVALHAVAVGIGAPIAGRHVDRAGPAPVLRMRAIAYPALIGAVVVLAVLDASIVAVGAAAALAGLALPPLSSTVRIVWPRIAPGGLRSSAYALEAALQEVFFVGGPLLAAGLAAVEPAAAVAAVGIASCVGTSATARLPPVRATPASRATGAGLLGALGSPGVRTVVLYAAAIGVGFGAVELAMPAFAEERGARELGGIALACFAAGSLLGGLAAGMRPPRSDLRRFIGGGVVLAAALLGLQLAVSMPTLYVLSFLAGLPIAPTIGALYALIDRSARAGTAAEAFAWFGTAVSIGIATGSATGGALVDERGVRWAFGFGAAAAFAGAFLAWVRRGTLRASSPAGAEEAEPASTLLTERT